MHISQTARGVTMRNQRDIVCYIINANVLQNFHICISAPLNLFIKNILDIPT